MSDRCYLTIECRECDVARFEALGFHDTGAEDIERPGIAILEESEGSPGICFDRGRVDGLPLDRPYLFSHGEGYEYGPMIAACDGSGPADTPSVAWMGVEDAPREPIESAAYAEVESDWERSCPVVAWDMAADGGGAPHTERVKAAMAYTALVKRVHAIFDAYAAAKRLNAPPPTPTRPLTDS